MQGHHNKRPHALSNRNSVRQSNKYSMGFRTAAVDQSHCSIYLQDRSGVDVVDLRLWERLPGSVLGWCYTSEKGGGHHSSIAAMTMGALLNLLFPCFHFSSPIPPPTLSLLTHSLPSLPSLASFPPLLSLPAPSLSLSPSFLSKVHPHTIYFHG